MPKRTEGPGPNPGGLCQCGCGQAAPLAKSSSRRYGSVKGKPLRYVYGHYQRRENPLDQYREEDRGFETPCHIWTGHISLHLGYGTYDGKGAHVLSYEAVRGSIPIGRIVHHRCEQKDCIRGDHLEAITRSDHPARHVKIGQTRWDEVRAATGSTRQIAARFGVSKSHVAAIRSGKQVRPHH